LSNRERYRKTPRATALCRRSELKNNPFKSFKPFKKFKSFGYGLLPATRKLN